MGEEMKESLENVVAPKLRRIQNQAREAQNSTKVTATKTVQVTVQACSAASSPAFVQVATVTAQRGSQIVLKGAATKGATTTAASAFWGAVAGPAGFCATAGELVGENVLAPAMGANKNDT